MAARGLRDRTCAGQHDISRVKAALKGSDTIARRDPIQQGDPDARRSARSASCRLVTHATPGSIGIASRSASLTSEVLAQCSAADLGQSTTVGVGGDTIHGVGFVDCLTRFREDDDTRVVVLVGEIGGTEEEDAADYLASVDYGKPVVALVVGRHAPQGRRMGHAGTLSIFGLDSAGAKIARLEAAGVTVVPTPDAVAPAIVAALG